MLPSVWYMLPLVADLGLLFYGFPSQVCAQNYSPCGAVSKKDNDLFIKEYGAMKAAVSPRLCAMGYVVFWGLPDKLWPN